MEAQWLSQDHDNGYTKDHMNKKGARNWESITPTFISAKLTMA